MTKVEMHGVLTGVLAGVDDPVMQMCLKLAASLVVSRLSLVRGDWLRSMLRDMAYTCDCAEQSMYAEALRSVVSAIRSG
jgi:hypothetical protein